MGMCAGMTMILKRYRVYIYNIDRFMRAIFDNGFKRIMAFMGYTFVFVFVVLNILFEDMTVIVNAYSKTLKRISVENSGIFRFTIFLSDWQTVYTN